MVFKARYVIGPAHVTVRLFVAKNIRQTFANIGSLTMTEEDWKGFQIILQRGYVQMIKDNGA